MLKLRKMTGNERGSATIEFLSMVPLVLFLTFVFFQFLIVGYNLIVAQSALNEASKVYSTTGSSEKAKEAVKNILSSSGNNITFNDLEIRGNADFTATLDVDLHLKFIPKNVIGIGNLSTIPYEKSINSRVIE